jgi:hypothetical protein
MCGGRLDRELLGGATGGCSFVHHTYNTVVCAAPTTTTRT